MDTPDEPTGPVTFLFTDIEGSTKLLRQLGDSYPHLISQHNRILREAIALGNGTEVDREGDAFFDLVRAGTPMVMLGVGNRMGPVAEVGSRSSCEPRGLARFP